MKSLADFFEPSPLGQLGPLIPVQRNHEDWAFSDFTPETAHLIADFLKAAEDAPVSDVCAGADRELLKRLVRGER